MERKCEQCPAVFQVRASQVAKGRGRFCSQVCSGAWKSFAYTAGNNPNWRGDALAKQCVVCDVPFRAKDPYTTRCPEHKTLKGCENPNWKARTERPCSVCDKPMSLRPFEVRDNKQFCSRSCANIIKNKNSKKNGTDIEIAVEAWLLSRSPRSVPYRKQVSIKGIALVDFVVGTTIIQCDGVYWHTLPGRAEQDARQDVALNALGYTVIRVSSDELKTEPVAEVINRKAIIASLHNKHRVTWQRPPVVLAQGALHGN